MNSRRALKLAEAVRHVVSSAILFELKDPRVQNVTVTYVEVAEDLRSAKVHVSIMGDEKRQRLTLRGLQSAAGFLQAKCAEKIETRWTPKLTFVLDQGVKRSIEVTKLLAEVLPSEASPETELSPTEEQEDVMETSSDSGATGTEVTEASGEGSGQQEGISSPPDSGQASR